MFALFAEILKLGDQYNNAYIIDIIDIMHIRDALKPYYFILLQEHYSLKKIKFFFPSWQKKL